ncbi:outer membrane protein, partial [Pseudomonadota bacterium]
VAANVGFSLEGGFLSLLPQIPIGDIGAVFLRLGIVAGDGKLTASIPSVGLSESESSAVGGVQFGIGGMINLGKNVSIRVEYDRVQFDDAVELAGYQVDTPDMNVITGSIIFRF